MNNKTSPPPWTVRQSSGCGNHYFIESKTGTPIASLDVTGWSHTRSGDIKLMAAAPYLLDILDTTTHILMDITTRLNKIDEYRWIIDKALAAIEENK